MNFQNPILKFVQADGRMDKPKAICPFSFSKVGGIKRAITQSNLRMTSTFKLGLYLMMIYPSVKF